VTSINQTGTFLNHMPQCQIGVRVEPAFGASFDAVVLTVVQLVQIPQYQPGAVVTVRYDPQDLSKVMIERLGA
jgi:hypothetical protein